MRDDVERYPGTGVGLRLCERSASDEERDGLTIDETGEPPADRRRHKAVRRVDHCANVLVIERPGDHLYYDGAEKATKGRWIRSDVTQPRRDHRLFPRKARAR